MTGGKTKRELLRANSRIFDPLEFLAPVTLTTKILVQDIWRCKTELDEDLPPSTLGKWNRCLTPEGGKWIDARLHVIADSSEQAYGVVTYLRFQTKNNILVSLVMAKSRVALLKYVTILRLKLCAALMATRLADDHQWSPHQDWFYHLPYGLDNRPTWNQFQVLPIPGLCGKSHWPNSSSDDTGAVAPCTWMTQLYRRVQPRTAGGDLGPHHRFIRGILSLRLMCNRRTRKFTVLFGSYESNLRYLTVSMIWFRMCLVWHVWFVLLTGSQAQLCESLDHKSASFRTLRTRLDHERESVSARVLFLKY